jgi:hypothetical protein
MSFFGGDKKKPAPLTREVGAPPAAPASLLGDLLPPDAAKTRSEATAAAAGAASRVRKRGAMGTLAATLPIGASPATAVLTPKTLTGTKSLVGY